MINIVSYDNAVLVKCSQKYREKFENIKFYWNKPLRAYILNKNDEDELINSIKFRGLKYRHVIIYDNIDPYDYIGEEKIYESFSYITFIGIIGYIIVYYMNSM